jgi:phosphoserine phosphatase SerB
MKNKFIKIKLVVFDLDDTLTIGPTIWELVHQEKGTWHSHGLPYYQAFQRGQFGFNAFIRKDVACWAGLEVTRLNKAIKKIRHQSGLKKTILALKKLGVKTAIISSGLDYFAQAVARKFKIDYHFANHLLIKNRCLTGKINLKVAGGGKGRMLRKIKSKLKIKKGEILAVGDSSFDLPMFREAGIKISFKDADKTIKKMADFILSKNNIFRLVSIIKSI